MDLKAEIHKSFIIFYLQEIASNIRNTIINVIHSHKERGEQRFKNIFREIPSWMLEPSSLNCLMYLTFPLYEFKPRVIAIYDI